MNSVDSNEDEDNIEELDALERKELEMKIENLLKKYELDKNDKMTLSDFIQQYKEREMDSNIDILNMNIDGDGNLNLDDVISAFTSVGVNINIIEATHLFKKLGRNNILICRKEWQNYCILASEANSNKLTKTWKITTHLKVENIDHHMTNPGHHMTNDEISEVKWWRHLVAGGIAGAVSRSFTAPLDRIKIFLQVHPTSEKMVKRYKKLLDEGGVSGLWRGNGINVIKIAPETAFKFAAYDHCKKLILGSKEAASLEIHERFISGAIAGTISQSAIYPLEVLKTRLALGKTGQYSGITDAARKMYAREGIKCFYKGYIPNVLGIIPYAGIDLAVYETLKKKYMEKFASPGEHPGMLLLLGCGSVSCTLAQICSYPLALVRTRLQALDSATIGINPSMRGIVRDILQKDGFKGLYRGLTPNLIKVIPAVSISYVVYEYASRYLGVKMT